MRERLGPRPHAAMTRCHGNVTIGADSRIVQPILVVDDDTKIVQLVRAYLEREGYPVVTAGDGRAALAAIEQHAPGLIVLDLMLPEIDGMTVARRVREDSDVPILMLSARGSVADRIQGMSEGADDYLPKPFSPAELVVRVKAILRRAGAVARRGPLRIALSSIAVTAAAVVVIVVGVFGFAARSFQQLMVDHGDTVAEASAMFDESVAGFFVLATVAGILGSIVLAAFLARWLSAPLGRIGA